MTSTRPVWRDRHALVTLLLVLLSLLLVLPDVTSTSSAGERKKDRGHLRSTKSSSDLASNQHQQPHKRRTGGGGSGGHGAGAHLKLSYNSTKHATTSPASTTTTHNVATSHQQSNDYYTYGVDLPTFAFDFSEYVVSATVSFSSSKNSTSTATSSSPVSGSSGRHSAHSSTSNNGGDDLYLYIYLLGHRAIYEDFPFDALYTDIDLIRNWQHAIEKWPKERIHTETDRSALFCVCKNNNADVVTGVSSVHQAQRLNRPYIVPAQWLHLAPPFHPSLNHSNFNRHIDILRCKLKNTQGVYSEVSYKKNKRLFVDLVRKDPLRPSANASLVVSFNIPWKSRQVGYPSMHGNGEAAEKSTTTTAITTTISLPLKPMKIAACVRGVRPLQQPRAEVTLPMMIEFIEHLFAIGVEHVVLGMALHWESIYYHRYHHVLSSYIKEGKVSFISTSDPESAKDSSIHPLHDDVSGFAGVQLHDSFVDIFFMNTCLSKMKGVAQYILSIKANQFLVPNKMNSTSSSWLHRAIQQQLPVQVDEIIKKKRKQFLRHASTSNGSSTSRGYHAKYEYLHMNHSRYHHRREHLTGKQSISLQHMDHDQAHPTRHSSSANHHAAAQNPGKTIALENSLSSLSLFLKHQSEHDFDWMFPSCSIRIPTTFVHSDPADSFSPWGPGDTSWTKEFYQSSLAVAASQDSYPLTVKLMYTKATMAVDVLESGEVLPICNDLSTLHHFTRNNNHGRNNHTTTAKSREVLEFTLPPDIVSTHVFQESFKSTGVSTTSHRHEESLKVFFEHIHDKINHRFASTQEEGSTSSKKSMSAVKKHMAEAKVIYEAQHGKEANGWKDRRDVKPPFWQHCNTEHLVDVMERILPSKSSSA